MYFNINKYVFNTIFASFVQKEKYKRISIGCALVFFISQILSFQQKIGTKIVLFMKRADAMPSPSKDESKPNLEIRNLATIESLSAFYECIIAFREKKNKEEEKLNALLPNELFSKIL